MGGSVVDGSIHCGQTVDVIFRAHNGYGVEVESIGGGLRVLRTDSAGVDLVDAQWEPNAGWESIFDILPFSEMYNAGSVDTAIFGGVCAYGDKFQVADSRKAWRLSLQVDCSDEGRTICIDSVTTSGVGPLWLWSFSGPYNDPVSPTWDGPYCFTIEQCCLGMRGDVNDDGSDADIGDLTYLVDYYFHGGEQPYCLQEANINGDPDEQLDISDLTYLVDYMFSESDPPCDCGTHAPVYVSKPSSDQAAAILTAYDSDTTFISCEANFVVRGVQLKLGGPSNGVPILTAADGLDMPFGFKDNIVSVGVLDLDGSAVVGSGQRSLLKIPGRYEVVEALTADDRHRTVVPTLGTGAVSDNLPEEFELSQNYPNPFNPATKISFGLPVGSDVKLEVFNILGQKVITLKDGHMPAGRYSVIWNGTSKQGKSVSSGVYFYRLETDGFTESKKMMLLK